MGLGEVFGLAANVLVNLKADNSDLKAKLKEVKGLEKEVVQGQIAANEARNKSYEGWAKRITQVNVALGVVTKAVEFAGDAFRTMDEYQDLAAASSKFRLDGLRKASAGLKTDMDLMRLAAAAQNTTFSLTQEQLEDATKAMRAFEEAGFDEIKVANSVKEAILKGNIEPLKSLGVNLEIAQGKGEKFQQLLGVIGDKAKQAGSGADSAADDFKRAGIQWENSITRLKVAIGELVVALAPLVSMAARVVGFAADIASSAVRDSGRGFVQRAYDAALQIRGQYGAGAAGIVDPQFIRDWHGRRTLLPTETSPWMRNAIGMNRKDWVSEWAGRQDHTKRGPGKPGNPVAFVMSEGRPLPIFDQLTDFAMIGGHRAGGRFAGGEFNLGLGAATGSSGGEFAAMGATMGIGAAATGFQQLAAQFAAAGEAYNQKKSIVEAALGPVEDFNGYIEGMSALGEAVGVFSGAMQAGFESWISGSKTAAEALKDMVGSILSGIASSMFAKSLEHGAAAIGSLALGDMKGAGTHGIAAGLYAAGAVTVGGLARLYNRANATPTDKPAGAGGRAPYVGGGSAGAVTRMSNVTVVMGGAMEDQSPRFRAQQFNRGLELAGRYRNGGSDAVVYG